MAKNGKNGPQTLKVWKVLPFLAKLDLSAQKNKAERGGFEPPVRFDPHTAFPVPHNRPLCHLSLLMIVSRIIRFRNDSVN